MLLPLHRQHKEEPASPLFVVGPPLNTGSMKSLQIALSSRSMSSLSVIQENFAKQIRVQVVPPSVIEALQVATANVALTKLSVLNTMQPFAQIAAIQSAQIEQALAPAMRTHRLMMESIAQSVRPSFSVALSALPSMDVSALYQGLELRQQWKTLAEQIYEQATANLPRFEEVADFLEELPQDAPSTSVEPISENAILVMGFVFWVALHVYILAGDESEDVFRGVALVIIDLMIAPTANEAVKRFLKDFNEFLSGYDPT